MEQALRFDTIDLGQLKLKETPEGYLEGYAIATRTGVFSYRKADGTVQRELRTPEEVFNQDAIDSFKLKPITNEHPGSEVNAENVKALSVGIVGQDIKKIDSYLAPYVQITDKQMVADVKSGKKRGLSFGYKVNLVKKDGIYNGEQYDYIQTNIRGNHLAIVYQGRAGDQAKLRLDSLDAICVSDNNFNQNLNMKKIKLDGKDFEVSEEIATRLDTIEAENSSLKKDVAELKEGNADLKSKCDKTEGERDSFKAKLEEEAKKDHSAEIESRVKGRIELEKKAITFFKSDEDFSKLSDKEIKTKVINLLSPEFKADGFSEDYLSARFDAIIELRNDANFTESVKAASNKEDSKSSAKVNVSNEELQRKLINKSNKKGE